MVAKAPLVLLVLMASIENGSVSAVSCLDESGDSVDYWSLMKHNGNGDYDYLDASATSYKVRRCGGRGGSERLGSSDGRCAVRRGMAPRSVHRARMHRPARHTARSISPRLTSSTSRDPADQRQLPGIVDEGRRSAHAGTDVQRPLEPQLR